MKTLKTTLYLIQTAAGLPAVYACLRKGNNRDFSLVPTLLRGNA